MSSKDHKPSSKDHSGKHKSASQKNREFLPTEEFKKSRNKEKIETGEHSEKKRVLIIKEEELAREKSTFKLKSNERGEGGERRRPKIDNEEVVNDKTEKRREHHKSGRHRTENLAGDEDPENERGEHRRHKRENENDRKHHEKKQHKIDTSQDEERRRRKHEMKDDKPEREKRERIEDGSRKHRRDKEESTRGIHGDPDELEEYRRRKEEKRERRHRREKEEQQAQRLTAENAIRNEPHDTTGPQTRAEYADNYDDDFEAVDDQEEGSSTPSGGSQRRESGSRVVIPDSSMTASSIAGSGTVSARAGTAGSNPIPVGFGHISFINFKIAHKRRCRDLVANAMLSRAFDLSRLIDMDRVTYDIVDVPPVHEHSQYMRLFGRAGCEHEASQTGDDNVGRDCQTEVIETRPGWTQCPPLGDGELDCGCGDGVPVHRASRTTTDTDIIGAQGNRVLEIDRLSVARLTTLIETILVEEARFEVTSKHPAAVAGGDTRSSLSKGYNQYSVAEILDGGSGSSGCCCTLARFPAANSNVFATVLRQHHSATPVGISASIAVWNVSGGGGGPHMLLTCTSATGTTAATTDESLTQNQVTCLSFSPDAGPSHVVAGLSSGVIALWDLREIGRWSKHRHMPPAYMTTCTSDPVDAEQWCHRGPITALNTVTSASTSPASSQVSSRISMTTESYQLLSLDSLGRLSVWLASAIPTSQSGPWAVAAGSLSDLNLRPGARFRLSRVTSIELSTNQPNCPGFLPVMTCMATDPNNNNTAFIGTGSGQLLRHHRATNNQHRQQSRVIGDDKAFSAGAITQIDFYPFFEQYLLAGYDDGLIRIFSVTSAKAILSFQHRAGTPVLQLRWSQSHPAVFLSLDAEGALCVWNVLLDLFKPALVQRLPGYIGFDLSTDSRWHIKDRHSSKNTARLLLWALDGRVEVHELADAFSSPELDDSFKTASLFQSLL